MARGNVPLYALNGGEVSKNALARVDVAKMRLAAQCMVNWLPWVVGAAMLRPGLVEVGEVLNDAQCKTLPFVYAKLDTAQIELTANTMRVRINEVLLTRGAVGTTIGDPNFNGGGYWTILNTTSGCSAVLNGGSVTLTAAALGGLAQIAQKIGIAGADQGNEHALRVVVANGPVTIRVGSAAGLDDYMTSTAIDTGTHSLPFTPTSSAAYIQIESGDQWAKTVTSCQIESAGIVSLPTSWAASDLPNLRWDQSGDVLYVACYGQQQRMIQRRGVRPGARGWSFVLYRSGSGPFHESADANITMAPAALSGNTTITASANFFDSTYVGALLRLFTAGQPNTTLIGAATTFTNPTRVTGIGADRAITVSVTGTFAGTWSLQRSLDGPDAGFATIASSDGGWSPAPTFTMDYSGTYKDDGSTASGVAYDNVIAWYRLGFDVGNYSGGSATFTAQVNTGGGYGIARILSVVSPTVVNVEVLIPFTSTEATSLWQASDWCLAYGWPTSVCFHEGRLWWFSGGQLPIAGSQSNNYAGYAEDDQFGNSLGDAAAVLEAFGGGPSDTVSWGLSLTRLLMGREQSIASARSSNFDQPLTPSAFVQRDCSDEGAERLPAIKVGKRGIYVQQSGRKVFELFFNAQEFDYDERDLTRLNLDIGVPGFVAIAKATQPDHMVHLPRTDGQSAALLYDVKDEIEAWFRIMTLGVIEDVCVLPTSGLEDLVYFVVRRTINGVTRRFIERLARRDQCVGGSLNYQLDCSFVYSGAPLSSSTIPWLPMTTIAVWADGRSIGSVTTDVNGHFAMPDGQAHANFVAGLAGAVVIGSSNAVLPNNVVPGQVFSSPQGTLTVGTQYNGYPCEVFADIAGTGRPPQHMGSLVVSGGIITLPNNQVASTIVAFLGYVAPFQSAKLAYAVVGGTALAQKKKLDHVGLILNDTEYTALQFGSDFAVLDTLPQVESGQITPAGTVWSEIDGPLVPLPGKWDTDSRLCLLAQAPKPCTVAGVVVAMQTAER
jgi:hypothetical protein